jgi:uncharacterized protein YlxW (UPF0749 family)
MRGLTKGKNFIFMGITMIVGFMLAVQFTTTNEPDERDTRDLWELREAIETEQEQQQELNDEILNYERLLDKYEQVGEADKMDVMKEALSELKKEAGLTEISGQGIKMVIEPLFGEELLGQAVGDVYPELLRRLINELNMYGANEMSIGGERIITRSPIREVNGQTYVNDKLLAPLPIEINVLTDNAEKLHNQMVVSQSMDDFAEENFRLRLVPVREVTLPPYDEHIRVKYMQEKEDA